MGATLNSLRTRLEQAGQLHVLRLWHTLDAGAQQAFTQQLEGIDWAELENMRRLVFQRNAVVPAVLNPVFDLGTAITPACLGLGNSSNQPSPTAAIASGSRALVDGRIGAILVAGGQGSRLGSAEPKGLYPIGPVSKQNLFEVLLGKLAAVRRRFGVQVPLAIMTSSATDTLTRQFVKDHCSSGNDRSGVLVFQQRDLPALDAVTGQLLLDAADHIAMAPDGHGGMLGALARCGGLDWFSGHGVEQIVSFQVDNPLAMPLNCEFLGYHILAHADFSTQVVRKQDPAERVGVVVHSGGVYRVVEYSDLPASLAAERMAEGGLKLYAGSIAVHAFSISFLQRMAARSDSLPLHLALKAVAHLNGGVDDRGRPQVPSGPNAIKCERFIFDLMPQATRVCVVEIDAADGFAPLKNPSGAASDSPQHVHAAMQAFACRVLAKAGVAVRDGIAVELDSAAILDAEDIGQFLPPGTLIDAPMVVGRLDFIQ